MNSLWTDSVPKLVESFPSLEEDISCDVCIIGGGITGISCAYYLSKHGLKVVVLEKDNLSYQTTGHTTAKITSQHGLFYDYLMQSYDKSFAKSYLEANEKAIQNIQDIIEENHISCDFEKTDAYVYTNDPSQVEKIKQEVDCMHQLNFPAEFHKEIPLPVSGILGAIRFPNQAKFHVRKYLEGLVSACLQNGVSFYEHTKVTDTKNEKQECITTTKEHSIHSRYTILATKYPFLTVPGFYFLKMYQSTSYVVTIETNQKPFPGMYITASEPTLSFRTAKWKDKEILLVGGSDHKTGANIDLSHAYTSLEEVAKSIYPDGNILYRWSTEDCITLDKIPYIGPFSRMTPNLFVATGYNKWGMTSSNVAANILCDMILGKENPYQNIFLSTRFHPVKNYQETGNMLKEATDSILLKKLKIPKDTISSIQNEEGKIIEIENKKIGIYKDEKGILHAVKPICSHLGCELTFNHLAKTWDCPCHGSIYDYEGHCIYGPSVQDIPQISLEEE